MHYVVGTAEYMSPEMLQGKGYGLATDFWAFGCIIYEMLSGVPPFMNNTKQGLYKLIKYQDPKLDYPFFSHHATDILAKLLAKDPACRLGSGGILEVKSHPWFAEINWDLVAAKQIKSPYCPQVESSTDVKYFDLEFT